MKRCPTCNRIFENDLKFCLDDGTILTIDSTDRKDTTPFAHQQTYGNRPANDPFQQPQQGWANPSSQPPVQTSRNTSPTPFAQGYAPPAQYVQRPAEFAPVAAFFLSLISLVLGLFSITFGWICLGFLTAPIAIVVGLAALVKIKLDWAKCANKALPIITVLLSLSGILSSGFVVGVFIIYLIAQLF